MSEAVFRLFVSSPGDVAAERARAEAVVEKLNAEFKDRARFEAVFWEDHFYSAHETFQDQIPEAADCNLVVAIFRARLGSPLPPDFKRQPDGEPYPSGSAYEVLSAIAKRRGFAQPMRTERPRSATGDRATGAAARSDGGTPWPSS